MAWSAQTLAQAPRAEPPHACSNRRQNELPCASPFSQPPPENAPQSPAGPGRAGKNLRTGDMAVRVTLPLHGEGGFNSGRGNAPRAGLADTSWRLSSRNRPWQERGPGGVGAAGPHSQPSSGLRPDGRPRPRAFLGEADGERPHVAGEEGRAHGERPRQLLGRACRTPTSASPGAALGSPADPWQLRRAGQGQDPSPEAGAQGPASRLP